MNGIQVRLHKRIWSKLYFSGRADNQNTSILLPNSIPSLYKPKSSINFPNSSYFRIVSGCRKPSLFSVFMTSSLLRGTVLIFWSDFSKNSISKVIDRMVWGWLLPSRAFLLDKQPPWSWRCWETSRVLCTWWTSSTAYSWLRHSFPSSRLSAPNWWNWSDGGTFKRRIRVTRWAAGRKRVADIVRIEREVVLRER